MLVLNGGGRSLGNVVAPANPAKLFTYRMYHTVKQGDVCCADNSNSHLICIHMDAK